MSESFSLSPSQTRILLAELNFKGTKAYYLYAKTCFPIDDIERVKQAIPYIFSGNLNLRIRRGGSEGFEQYYSEEPPVFEEVDATGSDLKEVIEKYKKERIDTLFDAPLYKIYLIRHEDRVILFAVLHHLISDGTTIQKILPALFSDYISRLKKNEPCENLPVTYDRFITRVREYLQTDESVEDREYWSESLSGYRGVGYMTDSLRKGTYALELSKSVTEKLKGFREENRISPFVLGLGASFVYFAGLKDKLGSRWSDMVWEISVHGRYFGDDLKDEIGMYVETIPLRLSFDRDISFTECLKRIKSVMKEGLSHAKTGTNEYFGELQKKGVDLRAITSFSVVSNSVSEGDGDLLMPDETDVPFHIRVNLNKKDEDGLQVLIIEYNRDIFTSKDIDGISRGIEGVLDAASDNPDILLSDIDYAKSGFISSECLVEKNIAVAEEPVSLQCGMNRDSATDAPERTIETVRDRRIHEEARGMAALLAAITRFGMTKDVLVGIRVPSKKTVTRIFPFGMHIDTYLQTDQFIDAVREHIEEVRESSDYPIECRTDLKFAPSIVVSFTEKVSVTDQICISVCINRDGLSIDYDADRYSKEYVRGLISAVKSLYDEMSPVQAIRDIKLVKEKSVERKIELKNAGTVDRVLHDRVEEAPDKEILIACDRTLTYRELDEESNKVANALISGNIKPGDRILILMRRTSKLVISVFGVSKAGAVFITMDPNYPRERINQIVEDSNAAMILTDIPEVLESDHAVLYDELYSRSDDTREPDVSLTPDDMCFIIYTSGTTGKPKGVVLSHRGITNYVAPEPENKPIYILKEKCRKMLCLSSVSFIVFLREVFGTILNGIPVVLCDEEQAVNPMAIAGLIRKYKIDAMGSTPTRLLQYSEVPGFCEILSEIRLMIVGGEGFPGRLFDVIRKYSACDIYNSYGPTEVTIASHQKKMDSHRVSAGFPMLNVWDRISDIDGNELPPYAVGEVYVGGAGVALGYYNDTELTEKRFPVIDGVRYCNTGDLGYKDEKGELFVLGRNDGMIKLRGLRIELEEVENALGNYPGVSHARVVVRTIQGTEHLCGFYTLKKGVEQPKSSDIRDHIAKRLPPYMVPSFYTCMAEFPMTPNGKVSVKSLKEIPMDTPERTEHDLPQTDMEKELFTMIAGLLKYDRFGTGDDLFTVGLTSLTMISLVSQIYDKYGVSLRVTDLTKERTLAGIAGMIDDIRRMQGKTGNKDTKAKQMIRDYYPLTDNQLGIYLDCVSNPESIGYHLPNILRFDASVDPERLKNAVIRTIEQHPYLKTTLVTKGGEVLQKRNDNKPVVEVVVLEKADIFTKENAQEFAAEPFDLNGGSLLRFKIVETPDSIVLCSVFHHLIVDGTSLNIVFREIAAAYDGQTLIDEKADGYQVSANEITMRNNPLYEKAGDYYKSRLAVCDEPTVLTAILKGDEHAGKLGVERIGIPEEMVDTLCDRMKISQNVLFMSALYVVLTKFISDDKLLLATVSNGRLDPALQDTVALLVRTMPLVLKEDRNNDMKTLFENVGNVWMDTLSNQIYPFTRIAQEYDIKPEFFYTYHGRIYESITLGGKEYTRDRVAYDSLRYKTMVNVILEDRYYIQVEYNDALYTSEYIRCFAGCMSDLIRKLASSSDPGSMKIRDITLGEENIRYQFKPLDTVMVHEVFEKMAAAQPDRPILTSCGETLTYDELNKRANRIAHALRGRGVREGSRVVLLLPRTCDLIASMVGVLKAGATYIPMDVEYPAERVAYVAEDSDADYVITSEKLEAPTVTIEELLTETDESNPPIIVDPDRICYMIYTSGSTGRPKGVKVTHKNLANLCVPVPENNYFYTRDKKPESVIQTATVSFDASILDIMPPLLNGIRVVFSNDEENRNVDQLVSLIRKEKPTMLGDMTPSRLLQYLNSADFAEEMKHFEACSVGGEAFLPALYDKIRELSDMDIYNSYGPTETTVHSNTRLIRKENIMSVGKALYNVVCEIRDIDGKLLPDGVMGELYIGGYGVSAGYNNMPEKTAEAFVTIGDIPYFKSGDYAYKLDNEEIVVMGRRDGQIKLRGLRIEIGEVEGSIEAYEHIEKAAVVIRKIGKTDHLCGYFSADKEINSNQLREFLASRLTPYMVPTVLMQLEEMPYTPNGKLDRKNLPEPVITREYVAPCTYEEEFFCHVFEQILDMEDVGATDDFFTIGGSSLLATQLTIMASNGGYEIKFRDVFDNPTPRKLAMFVTGAATKSEPEIGEEEKDIINYDYTKIHDYLKNNTFENYLSGDKHEIKNVILTGATGFLGIHVLKELLETPGIKVYCMLRGGRGRTALARLKNRLFYYFENDYSELDGVRLFVREGAITQAEDFSVFDDAKVDTIINCAASVKHFSAGTDIYDTNVTGVLNGLDYAKNRGIRYVHISTTSTAGEILLDGEHEIFTYDEKTLYKGQMLDNQYLSSKFLSERAVLEAAAEGADAKIIRVGNLMARDSDGAFQMNYHTNGYISRLRAYVTLHQMPYGKMLQKTEFSPINIVAKAIIALSSSPKQCCLFNCYNNHMVTYGDILNALNTLGIRVDQVDAPVFEASLKEAMNDESKQEGIYGLITTVGMGTRKERQLTQVNNDQTTQALYSEGIFWPVISEKYLATFIDFMKNLGFWE